VIKPFSPIWCQTNRDLPLPTVPPCLVAASDLFGFCAA
jgi:hypothetical protein